MPPALRSGERPAQQQQELLQQERVQIESLQLAPLEDNVNRALVYLELATEQARINSPQIAATIESLIIPSLVAHFQKAIEAAKKPTANTGKQRESLAYLGSFARRNRDETAEARPAHGGGMLSETVSSAQSRRDIASISKDKPSGLIKSLHDRWGSDETQTMSDIGFTYGEGSTSAQQTAHRTSDTDRSRPIRSALAELCEDSEPWTGTAVIKSVIGSPPEGYLKPRITSNNIPRALSRDRKDSAVTLQPTTPKVLITKPRPPPTPPLPSTSDPSFSWASVASIAKAASGFSGHLVSATTPGLPIHRLAHLASKAPALPTESPTEQHRAIWLANLPEHTTTHSISRLITTGGPLMSLLLCTDAADLLPGLSACIIFQHAADTHAFLHANSFTTPAAARVTLEAFPFPPSATPHPATLFKTLAPAAYLLPGGPFPIDADIAAMAAPTHARRRLKMTRSGLFREVSMAVFKRDVLEVVGNAQNVELWHFYNMGECTVVFASVQCASAVLAAIRGWSGSGGRRGSGNGTGNSSGNGVGKAKPDEKHERYKGVEVAYAHDFNERPEQKMWSCFAWEEGCGPDASGGANWISANGRSRTGWAYKSMGQAREGIWEGPPPAAGKA